MWQELRLAQLEADCCWCGNPEFVEGAEAVESSCTDYFGKDVSRPAWWCLFYFFGLDLKEEMHVSLNVSSVLPAAAWYRGFVEHHVGDYSGGYQAVHACVTVLVAFHRPQKVEAILTGMRQLLGWSGDERVCLRVPPAGTECERERHEAKTNGDWVHQRVKFMEMGDQLVSLEGNKRRTFGYRGILEVLKRQFDVDWSHLDAEMEISRVVSDEEDGLTGGFERASVSEDLFCSTVYAAGLDE
ncbi:hypothetical protein VDGL01_11830 [Verticillium dahliae]